MGLPLTSYDRPSVPTQLPFASVLAQPGGAGGPLGLGLLITLPFASTGCPFELYDLPSLPIKKPFASYCGDRPPAGVGAAPLPGDVDAAGAAAVGVAGAGVSRGRRTRLEAGAPDACRCSFALKVRLKVECICMLCICIPFGQTVRRDEGHVRDLGHGLDGSCAAGLATRGAEGVE